MAALNVLFRAVLAVCGHEMAWECGFGMASCTWKQQISGAECASVERHRGEGCQARNQGGARPDAVSRMLGEPTKSLWRFNFLVNGCFSPYFIDLSVAVWQARWTYPQRRDAVVSSRTSMETCAPGSRYCFSIGCHETIDQLQRATIMQVRFHSLRWRLARLDADEHDVGEVRDRLLALSL